MIGACAVSCMQCLYTPHSLWQLVSPWRALGSCWGRWCSRSPVSVCADLPDLPALSAPLDLWRHTHTSKTNKQTGKNRFKISSREIQWSQTTVKVADRVTFLTVSVACCVTRWNIIGQLVDGREWGGFLSAVGHNSISAGYWDRKSTAWLLESL